MPQRITEVILLGSHCDDIVIGMGATVAALVESRPGLRIRALVLTGAGTEREAEERAALADLCAGAELDVEVLDFVDGRTPHQWNEVKDALHNFAERCSAEIVFGPQPGDAHQDHRQLALLLPTVFRDSVILNYEIVKWETDTPQPTVYWPVSTAHADRKVAVLLAHYASQSGHDWFDEETFRGLLRLRGVQCRSRYAEGFLANKLVVSDQLTTIGG